MITWNVQCAHCRYRVYGLDNRGEAVDTGREHVVKKHAQDEEWEFRVQGIAPKRPQARIKPKRKPATPNVSTETDITPDPSRSSCAALERPGMPSDGGTAI